MTGEEGEGSEGDDFGGRGIWGMASRLASEEEVGSKEGSD